MSFSAVFLPLCALVAAMALPVQAAVNAQLARALGNSVAAVAVSFCAGLVLLILLVLTVFRDLPPSSEIARIPLWLFVTGGSLGVLYLIGNVVLVPRLGAAAMFSFAIAGQLIAALVLDKIGFLGLAVREISVGRLAGAALVLVGALMVRSL